MSLDAGWGAGGAGPKSSSSIDNSKTCRHAVRIFSLVLRITNEVTAPCRHEESDANNQFQGIERLGPWSGLRQRAFLFPFPCSVSGGEESGSKSAMPLDSD